MTYRWMKDNGTQTQIETNLETLHFDPLKMSDAGQYTCEVITLNNDIIYSDPHIISIQGMLWVQLV